ncbi:Hypothetical predicted protein [Pelobates cultripes]|uniref:C-type lectin domain-containing protein n=1 Tax=Pelobates cultripes TaxID=61616 RepID=A0AAD1VU87_PELCU|nr:Hypothetical predicted protein [Pelobates cultripes]
MEKEMESIYNNVAISDCARCEKQKKCGKHMVIIVILVISIFVALSIAVGILFMHCFSMSDELTELKKNRTGQERILSEIETMKVALRNLSRSCPQGWFAMGSSCYYISENKMTWLEARYYCHELNSKLAIITSMNEMDSLFKLLKGYDGLWIGLHRDSNEINSWKWLDGAKMTFSYWGNKEPNNEKKNEECVEVLSGAWNDEACSERRTFMCKKTYSC